MKATFDALVRMFERAIEDNCLFTWQIKPTFLQRSVKVRSPQDSLVRGFSDAMGPMLSDDCLMAEPLAVTAIGDGNDCPHQGC